MKKILILTILAGILCGCEMSPRRYGAYREYNPIYVPTDTYNFDYRPPEYKNYIPEQRTSMLDEWNRKQEQQRLERRMRDLERFKAGWMDRQRQRPFPPLGSPYPKLGR